MFKVPEQFRLKQGMLGSTEQSGNNGMFEIPRSTSGNYFRVTASNGLGWEHVSVSLSSRTPTWDEMCFIKDLFWDEGDCVIQYHPPKSSYVNRCETCLHLWRRIGKEIEIPSTFLV